MYLYRKIERGGLYIKACLAIANQVLENFLLFVHKYMKIYIILYSVYTTYIWNFLSPLFS